MPGGELRPIRLRQLLQYSLPFEAPGMHQRDDLLFGHFRLQKLRELTGEVAHK